MGSKGIDAAAIGKAVEILRRGGLVAFPTETVYGLGADATRSAAVRRIFLAKGRPATNPLIVHVADEERARRYAAEWPAAARRLAREFWPGPLTLVVPKSPAIVAEATAGLETVGLRAPDHALTLELLRQFDGPLAGPSANRSQYLSPTTAEHVRQDLGAAVDLVLDGGPCRVGIESTVLDLTAAKPIILRLGGISRERIEAVVGRVEVFAGAVSSARSAASPGQQAVHYAPRAPAFRFESGDWELLDEWRGKHTAGAVAVLSFEGPPRAGWSVFLMPADEAEYAHRLYATLRQADRAGVAAIWVEMPPDEPRWAAVRDRLKRATGTSHGS